MICKLEYESSLDPAGDDIFNDFILLYVLDSRIDLTSPVLRL